MQIVNLMMLAATKPLILQRSEYEYANVALFFRIRWQVRKQAYLAYYV